MTAEKLLGLIDRKLVIDLASEMIETPSPTGEEGDMARLLVRAFDEVGCNTTLQNIYDDRHNAIGRIPGSANGPVVLMSGHMDTSASGNEPFLAGRGWKNRAVLDGGRIWGNGICNMKHAFVSYIAGIDALRRAGIKLKGDLIVAGTAGEIELAPVDEFQGQSYDSYGVGLRFMLVHGVAADFHFLGEPTAQVPSVGTMGSVWAKITTYGEFSHTAWSDKHLNAIDEMTLLWEGIGEWIPGYREDNIYMGVWPQVNRGAIRGGRPWRASRTAHSCSAYVDMRFPPTRYPIDVQREFTAAVHEAARLKNVRLPVDVEYYISRGGTSIAEDHLVIQSIVDAHREVTGKHVPAAFCPPYCADAIDANRFGVPTCIYGSGGSPSGPTKPHSGAGDARASEGEFVEIDDMVNAAAVYMTAAVRLNDSDLETVIAQRGTMPSVHLPEAG